MKRTNFQKEIIVLICFFIFNIHLSAQSTLLKLPTTDETSSFDITRSDSVNILKLFGDGGFYLSGEFNNSVIPFEGPGTRLTWYPGKAAFRVGGAIDIQWDDSNIGDYSIAMGLGTIAGGGYSVATGYSTTANGIASTVMGYFASANGDYSSAMGLGVSASGDYSTARGYSTIASGDYSIAIGFITRASGDHSTAMGSNVSTNNFTGAFIIGDSVGINNTLNSSAPNQMTMRFAGGYRLFTNSGATIGVQLNPNDNSWSTISDSTKKENFIFANGEQFLNNLSKLKLGSWNYKTQDENKRHYGPMAQEIFHYFGKDELGPIGNDTTLSTSDMDGIIMICLQALEKRTAELQKATERIYSLENTITFLLTEIKELKTFNDKANRYSFTIKENEK
jgi:hypothetical protein